MDLLGDCNMTATTIERTLQRAGDLALENRRLREDATVLRAYRDSLIQEVGRLRAQLAAAQALERVPDGRYQTPYNAIMVLMGHHVRIDKPHRSVMFGLPTGMALYRVRPQTAGEGQP